MKEKNKSINVYQAIAGIIYALIVIGIFLVVYIMNSVFFILIGMILFFSATILFYFMYALGEIVKQLRISNEMLYDNDENK